MFETLPQLIRSLADAPDGHGVVFGDRPLVPWRRLYARVLRRAETLDAGPGDRVPITLGNDPASLETFLALLWAGAVPLSLPTAPFGQAPQARAAFLEAVARAAEGPVADDVALVQFSSGSTSRPKGICLTHANLAANVELVIEAGGRHAGETLVTWVPMSHDMGLVGTWLSSLAVRPRRVHVMQPMRFLMRPLSWIDALSRESARVSTCPSFALDRCVERCDGGLLADRGVDLSSLEALLVGAETVRPQTLARFVEAFRPFGLDPNALVPVYGLAEATLIVTAHPRGEPVRTRRLDGTEVVSVGRPLGDFELRVEPEGGVGEIRIRGSCVTPGLLDPAGDDALFDERGWLRTGDLGALDEDGNLYVTGRSKDLLIVDGRNYYAHDIGAALADMPALRAGRTHAFTAHAGGRKRVVVLAVRRGSADTAVLAADVKRRVLARCGVAVDDVLFVRRIPRTSSGKVERHACEALYREHQPA